MLVLLAILLASLVYQFVEKPFRTGRLRNSVFGLVVAMAALASFGFATYLAKGESSFPIPHLYQKIYDGDFASDEFFQILKLRSEVCEENSFLGRAKNSTTSVRCWQSKTGEPVTTLIIGDSHAESLFPGIAKSFPARNVGAIVSGYAPILGNPGFKSFFQEIQKDRGIQTVIISAYWIASTTEFVPTGSSLGVELEKAIDLITNAGKQVYLIVDNPSFHFPPEFCRYSRLPTTTPRCSEDKSVFLDQLGLYFETLKKIETENSKVKILDPSNLMCDDRVCSMVRDGKLLYRDSNHLSIDGSEHIGAWIAKSVN